MRRRRQDHDVNVGAKQFLERVETDEAAIGRDGQPVGRGLLQLLQAFLEPVGKGVGHGRELDVRVGRESVGHRAGAASAAADQADLQRVAAGRVGRARDQQIGRHRAGDDRRATVLEKVAA